MLQDPAAQGSESRPPVGFGLPYSSIRPHVEGAVRQGIPLPSLLARSCIELRTEDGSDLVSPAQRLLLCLTTVAMIEDATHGLARKGVRAKYPAIGLGLALGCATLGVAIETLGRFYASESSAVRIQLTTERDWAVVAVQIEAKVDRDVAYLEENFLTWIYMQMLRFLGRAPPVAEVTVRDPFHFNLGRRHWGFGGVVRHGDVTAIRVPRSLLMETPLRGVGDDPMWECHSLWLAHLDGATPTAPADYVTDEGFVRFADLVRASGASANTLRRRLQRSDRGFRDARQRALVQAATERLQQGRHTVETIAAEFGYSDTKNFRRFLKNATGLTPGQIRARRPALDASADARARERIMVMGAGMNV